MDPVIVLVVAIFVPVIAYFLYGQWQKGIAAIGAYGCAIVLAVVTCGVGAVVLPALHIVIILDAFMQAKLLKEGRAIRQWSWFTQAA